MYNINNNTRVVR